MVSSAADAPRTGVPLLRRRVLRAGCLLLLLSAYSASAVAQVTVESKSGPFFIINDKQSRNHVANYVGYRITNTSGAAYSDLTVELANFQGGVVSLGDHEDGEVYLGALANGASATAYFYLQASAETSVEQSHDVEVYEGGARVETSDTTFSFVQTGDFAPVHTAISASANKVDSVRVSGTPTVGGTFTMTVYGRTGVIGAPGDVLFSPATIPEWPADTFQLESSVISIGSPVTLVITDDLYENLIGVSNQPYTLVYTFRVKGTTSGVIDGLPLSYLASGQKIKHEDLDPSTTNSVPEVFQVVLAMSGAPTVLEPGHDDPDGGTVTYTVTLTNAGVATVPLARIVVTLPNSTYGGGAAGDVTYGGNATFGGSPIADPTNSNATLTWTGPFTIPAGGSVDLTFEGVFPKTGGSYVAPAIAIFNGNGIDQQVDTTMDMTDDAPGLAATFVSDGNLPVELVLFEALADGADALLRWETASETNNAGFEIHSKFAGANLENEAWTVLGFVDGHGTTAFTQSYAYRVEGLSPGRHIFRLKQIDFDGTCAYHPEVEVVVEMAERFVVEPAYPNPFNPQAQFRFAVQRAQPVRVALYDVLGRQVQVLYDGDAPAGQMQTVRIDGSALPSGLYLVRVAGASFVNTQPVTLLK